MPPLMSSTMADRSANVDDLDQPIALRRSKRRSEAISPTKSAAVDSANHAVDDGVPHTPSKARGKKRVRFSDPGQLTTASSTASCGLTPALRRTALSTPRRRASTPANLRTGAVELQFAPLRQVLDDRAQRRIRRNGLSEEMNAYESERKNKAQLERDLHAKDEELQKLKKEIEAVKNASSDGANRQAMEELSSSQKFIEEELQTLRQSFDEASMPSGFDDEMDINWDAVHAHKAAVTPAPASDSGDTILIYEDNADVMETSDTSANVANATRSAGVDTNADAELLAMALDLETAKQEKRQLFKDLRAHIPASPPSSSVSRGSNPSIHFEDSPASSQKDTRRHELSFADSLSSPPKTFYTDLSKALKSTTHRAESAELALHALEADLRTLGFTPSDDSSTTSILENIRTHFRQARLDLERALPGETVSGLNKPATVLPEAISKLKLLSRQVQDREAELRSMHEQQRTLKGNFECGLRAAEKANQRIKELEDAVEEGADDLLHLRTKLLNTEKDVTEKDHTITSLITALDKYRADVSRLEGLAIALESDQAFKLQEGRDESAEKIEELEAKAAAEQIGRRKAEESAVARLSKITALQAALDAANDGASSLQIQLSALEAQKTESEIKLHQSQSSLGKEKEHHDVEVQNLNTRISTLSTALAASQAECTRLHALVEKLRSRLSLTQENGLRNVETLYQEQIRAATKVAEVRKSFVRGCKVRAANWEMEDEDDEDVVARKGEEGGEPMTPVSLVRFVDVERERDSEAETDVNAEGEVEGRVVTVRGRGRKSRRWTGLGIESSCLKSARRSRQRLDSGISMGCLSEEEEEQGETMSSDAVLPSSDSDSGFEIHEDVSSSPPPHPAASAAKDGVWAAAEDLPLPSSELGLQDADE